MAERVGHLSFTPPLKIRNSVQCYLENLIRLSISLRDIKAIVSRDQRGEMLMATLFQNQNAVISEAAATIGARSFAHDVAGGVAEASTGFAARRRSVNRTASAQCYELMISYSPAYE